MSAPSALPNLLVHRLGMDHPGDVSALALLLESGDLRAEQIVAVIGKTEGNGGVNDFTRGYFTQSLMGLLAAHLRRPASALVREIPCILSGGTEGVLSPHYIVFARTGTPGMGLADRSALAIGTAISADLAPQAVGRWAHARAVAATVRAAMRDGAIARPQDVSFVQVKCPCVTSARAEQARLAGQAVRSADPGRSMAYARAAGAFGVAIALGEMPDDPTLEDAMLADFARFSDRASISSGVEVVANEVIVLGHSAHWGGDLRIGCAPMQDALDIGGVVQALHQAGLGATPQLPAEQVARVAAVFVKCEPDRRGQVRGHRHTMLDDTDINAQRHIRGALGGLVAGVIGDGRIFVSGGAEHQGPDGGGLVAVIAHGPDA